MEVEAGRPGLEAKSGEGNAPTRPVSWPVAEPERHGLPPTLETQGEKSII